MEKEGFIKYLLKYKHREEWFKWIEWVTLTVIVCTAWWKTQSYFVFPLAALSVLYIWHSFFDGFTSFLGGYLSQRKFNEWQVKAIVYTLSPFFIFGPLVVFVPLLAGML